MTNRRQMLLFMILTVLLTAVTVAGIRFLFKRSETLVMAVGDANGVEARFADKLAAMLQANGSRYRLKIQTNADNNRALTQFDRQQADLAILRTDAKVPGRARSIAILEHDLVLLLSPGSRKIASLSALKNKKIAVIGDGSRNDVFVRKILGITEDSDAATRVELAPPGMPLDKLLAPSSGYSAVIAVAHASKLANDKSYAQAAKAGGGFIVNKIDESAAIARKFPEVSEEKIDTGLLSTVPQIPDDDLDTIGLQWLLVAQSKLSPMAGGELARLIAENKADLALDDGFAGKIEPADIEKTAFVAAQKGTADYLNDDTKTFIDRYSDLIYLAVAAMSVIGSIFAGIYARFTRVAPEKASELAISILDVGERIEEARSLDALEQLQDELEAILRRTIVGLRDETINSDGLDTFRLGYEIVRDEIAMRRESLKRHGDENVVVKTVQGG
ncbi:MAG: C4-dicarboxylate ABC transporter substrate-binding protein [Proteobacteria bacterium]|nr:C4-dicarboxylate ABC transporter substrate-binding protein [Pseudomonadota bacterium]